jgi:hypothetical protein
MIAKVKHLVRVVYAISPPIGVTISPYLAAVDHNANLGRLHSCRVYVISDSGAPVWLSTENRIRQQQCR